MRVRSHGWCVIEWGGGGGGGGGRGGRGDEGTRPIKLPLLDQLLLFLFDFCFFYCIIEVSISFPFT